MTFEETWKAIPAEYLDEGIDRDSARWGWHARDAEIADLRAQLSLSDADKNMTYQELEYTADLEAKLERVKVLEKKWGNCREGKELRAALEEKG
jgi:hypothetical protein